MQPRRPGHDVLMGAAAFAATLGVSFLLAAGGLLDALDPPEPPVGRRWLVDVPFVLLVVPVGVALLMAAAFRLLSPAVGRHAALAATVVAAVVLHGLSQWQWGVIMCVPLAVFAFPFLDATASTRAAIGRSALTQGVHNALAVAGLAIMG